MTRKALLLGVLDYEDDSLSQLDMVPQQDVFLLAEALSMAGYDKDNIKMNAGKLGYGSIKKSMRNFMQNAQPNDTLFIYFSGHGCELNECRYLVPSDFDTDEDVEPNQLYSEQDVFKLACSSNAQSIVFFIDACRDAITLKFADAVGAKSINNKQSSVTEDARPSIAFIYSCEANSRAYYGPDENSVKSSFFARALASVLQQSGENSPARLNDIVEHTQHQLANIANSHQLKQNIKYSILNNVGIGGNYADILLREDAGAAFSISVKQSDWCQQLQSLNFWKDTFKSKRQSPIELQTMAIVLACEHKIKTATKPICAQRWRPDDAPFRVLRKLSIIYDEVKDSQWLTPSETSLLVCVPFVYEAILAFLEIEFAEVVGNDECPECNNIMQQSWTTYKNEESAWARHIKLLKKKGNTQDAADLLWRQVYQFAYHSGELWSYTPNVGSNAIGWVNEQLELLLKLAPFADVKGCKQVQRVLASSLTPTLARMMFVSAEDIARFIDDGEQNEMFKPINGGEGTKQWRCEPLKVLPLLAVVSKMALDPRRLHDSLTEHIGLTSGFNFEVLKAQVDDCSWPTIANDNSDEVRFSLSLQCDYQIVDFALEHSVKELTMIANSARQSTVVTPVTRLFFDCKGVIPNNIQGMEVYSRPHVRFSLNERKTMQLLMGEKLYGDPQLALRELYQNALDACRYREARVNYLTKIGEQVNPFVGKIIFSAGREDITQRPYIICKDNGIGMTEAHLSRLFAHGGSRFAESHDFQVERAQWKLQDIEFYPNSRFGVGVLSYFMLADQVDVKTSRLSENANGRSKLLSVTIEGSNSIFQVRKENTPSMEHGTSIKLYLQDESCDPNTVLDSIKKWLVLPEYEVEVQYSGRESDTLAAGKYRYSEEDRESKLQLIAIPQSARANQQIRLFLAIANKVNQKNYQQLATDGVRLNTKVNGLDCVFFNHADDYHAELSVDRLQLMTPEQTRNLVREELEKYAWQALLNTPALYLVDLAQLVVAQPIAMQRLHQMLCEGQSLMVKSFTDSEHDLAGIGLSAFDLFLTGRESFTSSYEEHSRSRAKLLLLENILCTRIVELNKVSYPLQPGLELLGDFKSKNQESAWRGAIGAATSALLYRSLWNSDLSIPVSVNSLAVYCDINKLPLTSVSEFIASLNTQNLSIISNQQIKAMEDKTITTAHIRMARYEINSHYIYKKKVPLAQLVRVAILRGLTLVEMVDFVTRMINIGLTEFTLQQAKVVANKINSKSLKLIDIEDYRLAFNTGKLFVLPIALNKRKTLNYDLEAFVKLAKPFTEVGLADVTEEQLNVLIGGTLSQQAVDLYLDVIEQTSLFDQALISLYDIAKYHKSFKELTPLLKELITAKLTNFNLNQLSVFIDDDLPPACSKLARGILIKYRNYQPRLGHYISHSLECGIVFDDMVVVIGPLIDRELTNFNLAQLKTAIAYLKPSLNSLRQDIIKIAAATNDLAKSITLKYVLTEVDYSNPLAVVYEKYQSLLDANKDIESLILKFDKLSASLQNDFFKAWNKTNDTISLVVIANLLIKEDANWQAMQAGLELLALCDVDINETQHFVSFCQEHFEKQEVLH